MNRDSQSISFWRWFFRGTGGKPGFRRLINVWLLLHLGLGIVLAEIIPIDLGTAANAVLLPLAAVLVGLSFAWAGNAQALLQATEIEKIAEKHVGGLPDYVFTFQAAILCILVTLVAWGLAGFQIFEKVWPTPSRSYSYLIVKIVLFTLSSVTVRECWHIVLAAQWMLLIRYFLKRR
jgi:uncharacterized membrane protein